ncbi:ABC-2 transporter permease [Anaerosacchariphilus polymeriproducens]|uniref:ABC-2 transporter permease n=1 Tax=Anaerosacchariphilus polymeriproducens TaxID=1812858 RepID=A0A371ASP9_9FIRM|nr:ABC-2 transporter permease [Anaerosacchariphilus polymeriproducens]RDU22490.1 ABC-2 transporter permease [Anaerosacchariphilus polymeriproducens]
MIGLILKDIMNLKKQAKIYILLLAFYGFLAYSNKEMSMVTVMICLLNVMLSVTALAYDEKANWEKYALSMPITRKDLIMSKYCLGLLGLGFGVLVSIAFSLIIPGVNTKVNNLMILYASLAGLGALSILFPLLFKFGVEKGRLMMMLMFFLPTVGIVLFSKLNLPPPSIETIEIIKIGIPIFVILLFVISIIVSNIIYKKKEF